jgi:hypothetical protein
MTKVAPGAELLAQLRTATESVQIVDENGNVIGTFVPNAVYERIMTHFLPEPTKEELAEARTEMLANGGVSGEELRARLADIQRQWEARQ